MATDFNLERFVIAQSSAYEAAMAELRHGRKQSHWIWFIFPQMKGLGLSSNAEFFGIGSLQEAEAYLAHPILGPRLLDATRLMLAIEGRTLREILGTPDDMKFRSSMTLFEKACPAPCVFREALEKFCGGKRDERTVALL
ncbi:MAG: DUF1810 domain-containing protein [Hyphomicrobium sp.]|nr:DUF1810 domain-containing protein [Hyphomicrobium sp.]